ncbi:hypothetical protein MHM84_17780 [Halomonas sp. McH1-25]|uniref:hypothetical protein n=3 Tax=Halomonas TaxID=2745 RepID=UPI001EF5DC7B|nr:MULTISPECIES: hypothetical protein [unclassified Halomonas]MCG7601620.1 hypothetical protein [Halomonas sp. McH1-25]MCP1342259.1 hypothetical protein [Halomonas sp. FL8]
MNALLRSLSIDRHRLSARRCGVTGSSRPRLLLLCESPEPPSAETDHVAIHWIATGLPGHAGSGRIAASDDTTPAHLAKLSQQYDSVLLLSPTATSHFHLAAPKGLRQREWPLLIEDQLCSDDTPELAALKQGRDHLELLVTGRERLLGWQRWLSTRGIRTTHWASVFMALPAPASAGHANIVNHGHHLLIKTLAEPPSPHAPATEHWLAWPRDWQAHLPVTLREKTWHWPWQDNDDTASPDSSMRLQHYARHLPKTLPTMPGNKSTAFSLRHAALPLGRPARRLAAAIAALALLNMGTIGWQGYLDQRALAADTQARLESLFPVDTGAPSLRWMQDRHVALRSLQQRNQWLTEALERIDRQTRSLPLKLAYLSVTGTQLILHWQVVDDVTSDGPELAAHLANLGETEWHAETQRLSLHVALTEETPPEEAHS